MFIKKYISMENQINNKRKRALIHSPPSTNQVTLQIASQWNKKHREVWVALLRFLFIPFGSAILRTRMR